MVLACGLSSISAVTVPYRHTTAGPRKFSRSNSAALLSTKVVTTSGPVDVFVIALVAGYGVGTALLQLGYQTGGALTVAGLATLLSNAVPIVAGTVVLHEPVPSGPLGGLRALAVVAVSAGAFLLAQPDDPGTGRPVRGAGVTSARRSPHAA
jgi:hypothetical protein